MAIFFFEIWQAIRYPFLNCANFRSSA